MLLVSFSCQSSNTGDNERRYKLCNTESMSGACVDQPFVDFGCNNCLVRISQWVVF